MCQCTALTQLLSQSLLYSRIYRWKAFSVNVILGDLTRYFELNSKNIEGSYLIDEGLIRLVVEPPALFLCPNVSVITISGAWYVVFFITDE